MPLDIGSWLIFATTVLIFIVFLIFDLFKRNEPYGNLAYIVAIIPVTYLWMKITETPLVYAEYADFGTMGVWNILFVLWLICMIRDMIFVAMKKKEFDDVVLYIIIGIIVQLIVSAILPSPGVIPSMQQGSFTLWFFWLPNPDVASIPMYFMIRILITLLTLGVIIPLVSDLRGESVNMFVLLIITGVFAIPFGLICFLWIGPDNFLALLFLVSVLFFIILLMMTRGQKPQKNTLVMKKKK
jgi:hypothetical protein